MNYPCQTGLLINGRVLIKTRWQWTASAYKRTVAYKQAVIYKGLDLIDGDCLLRHTYDENLLYFISASTSAASTLPVSSTQFSSPAGIVIIKADNKNNNIPACIYLFKLYWLYVYRDMIYLSL